MNKDGFVQMIPQDFKSALEIVVILFLLVSAYCYRSASVLFHPDESQWIVHSYLLEEFTAGRFSSPAWQKAYASTRQPSLVFYVIGLGRRLGGFRVTDLNIPKWQWNKDVATNIRNGAMPPHKLLWWSRLPMLLLAVISIAVGFVLLRESMGRTAGYIWIILCAVSPYFLLSLRRAMAEACLLAGVMFVAFACYRALRDFERDDRYRHGRTFLWLILAGVGTGFAGASKLNGVFALVAGLAVAAVLAIRLKRSITGKLLFLICAFLATILSASLTFGSLNPYLWPAPAGMTVKMYQDRIRIMDRQQDVYPQSSIDTIAKRVCIVPERVFQRYAAIGIKGFLLPNIIFFITGLGCGLRRMGKWIAGGLPAYGLASIGLAGLSAATAPLFTPLDWARYYVLPVFFTTLFIAIGMEWYANKIWRLSRTFCDTVRSKIKRTQVP